MTRDRFAELDETPEQPWRPTSTPGIRKLALQATAEAVQRAKDARKKPAEETS